METRHKRIKIFEKEINVRVSIRGDSVVSHKIEIQNAGKIDHKLNGNYLVTPQSEKKDLTIKFFILTVVQFLEWVSLTANAPRPAFASLSNSQIMDPTSYLYSSKGPMKEGSFDLSLENDTSLYLIFDNSFSSFKSKTVKLTVWEEWDEKIEALDVVTTIPPQDTSLNTDIGRMISSSKKSLKIIAPFFDMTFVKELLEKYEKGIIVNMISQGKGGLSGNHRKQAFDIIQNRLGKQNHRINELVHSRLIIVDDLEALISSADLNVESMHSQYNAGVLLSDPPSIQKLVNYFNQVWKDSESAMDNSENQK